MSSAFSLAELKGAIEVDQAIGSYAMDDSYSELSQSNNYGGSIILDTGRF